MNEARPQSSLHTSYPEHIAAALRRGWAERALDSALLPCADSVEVLIDTMYQASLLQEESQGVQCRIIAAPPAPSTQSCATAPARCRCCGSLSR